MHFRIADTFTDSLARLTGEEQKAVKLKAFDLQINPSNPGMSFHKLDRAKDKNFGSVRVNANIRIIVHKTSADLLLCYVDHHDQAYAWAERRKIETHPSTGAAQLVEIRERVQEVVVPTYVTAPTKKAAAKLFTQTSDEELLGYGVPAEWIADVRAADQESIFTLVEHLPAEAGEALLELAIGGKPGLRRTVATTNPFEHPDALRRFRVLAGTEELAQALNYPWDKWTVFLHPDQRQWIERDSAGPARVAGSAGTGKTVVALHRAAYLARANPNARVLLATFSDPLAGMLQTRLNRLLSSAPRLAERIDVHSLGALARRLYKMHLGSPAVPEPGFVRDLIEDAAEALPGKPFTLRFLLTEWEQVVDAWQLESWEAYRDVARLGRKTRLPESQRRTLWTVFEKVATGLQAAGVTTEAALFTRLATHFSGGKKFPFEFAVVDEAQDLSVPQLRFLAALGADRANGLFFAGDLGQRIFQVPFSWKSLGVDVRGRSRTLRVNYRTSHQIRTQADLLLDAAVGDVDGNADERDDTVSIFNGPAPRVQRFKTEPEECQAVGAWIRDRLKEDVAPHEIGLFVRSAAQLNRAKAAAGAAGVSFQTLDEKADGEVGSISVSTMHSAKGLEFRAVAVMACDDEVIPSQERIEAIGDEADLKEVYDTERHLLYVACTRARDNLLVSCVKPGSEFLDDFESTPRR